MPFGVRAIQSGIEVDGIWVSNTNTPVPSELNLSSKGSSSELSSGRSSSKSINVSSGRPSFASSSGTILPTRPKSEIQFRDRVNGSAFFEHTEGSDQLESGRRKSYQPRRSSGLRFHDTRSHHEATLADLESGASHPMLQPRSYPPQSSATVDSGASSVADNELNLGNCSDSDGSLGAKDKGKGKAREYMTLAQDEDQTSEKPITVAAEHTTHYTDPSYLDAKPAPLQPDYDHSCASRPLPPSLDTALQMFPPRPRSRSPFIPGELHQNKVVRKINSGFEVLPAGTFGTPTPANQEMSTGEDVRTSEDSDGQRRRNRLQKKRRESILSARSVARESR